MKFIIRDRLLLWLIVFNVASFSFLAWATYRMAELIRGCR